MREKGEERGKGLESPPGAAVLFEPLGQYSKLNRVRLWANRMLSPC